MRPPARAFPALLALCAASGLIAACGDDDGGDETATAGDPSRLRFYDWEPNLVTGPVGRPDIAESECPEPRCVVVEEGGAYFALRDQPALTGEEIVDPELSADPVSGDPADLV